MSQFNFFKLKIGRIWSPFSVPGLEYCLDVNLHFSPSFERIAFYPITIPCTIGKNGSVTPEEKSIIIPFIPRVVSGVSICFLSVNGRMRRGISHADVSLREKGPGFFMEDDLPTSFYISASKPPLNATTTTRKPTIHVSLQHIGGSKPADTNPALVEAIKKSADRSNRVTYENFISLFKFVPDVAGPQKKQITCPGKPDKLSWAEFPLYVNPHSGFTFGGRGRQLTIGKDNTDSFNITNRTDQKLYFQIGQKRSGSRPFLFWTEPACDVIAPRAQKKVTVHIRFNCTTTASLSVPIRVWGDGWRTAYQAPIYVDAQSCLSNKLDPNDIELCGDSYLAKTQYTEFWIGKYRGTLVNVERMIGDDLVMHSTKIEEADSMMQTIRHPCIVQYMGSARSPTTFTILTEYCPFMTLDQVLAFGSPVRRNHATDLNYSFFIHALLDVSRALDYLHRNNIIHRNVKTSSVFVYRITPSSNDELWSPVCKLGGFTSARTIVDFSEKATAASSEDLLMMTRASGPLAAPDMSGSNSFSYGTPVDIFSFGVMAFEILEGRTFKEVFARRFQEMEEYGLDDDEMLEELMNDGERPMFDGCSPVSKRIKSLVNRCWDGDADKRPEAGSVAGELEAELMNILDIQEIQNPYMPKMDYRYYDFSLDADHDDHSGDRDSREQEISFESGTDDF